MDLEQADLLQHADTCVWDGLDPDSPEFADAFWDSVTPCDLPSAPPNEWVWYAGLPQALSMKRLRLVALRRQIAADSRAAIGHCQRELALILKRLLLSRVEQMRYPPPDPVHGKGRVAALLTPRLARPNSPLAWSAGRARGIPSFLRFVGRRLAFS